MIVDKYTYSNLKIEPTTSNFTGTKETIVCSGFGCGNYLSLVEQLCGGKCLGCMGGNSNKFFNGKI